jgi:hypothetical protein
VRAGGEKRLLSSRRCAAADHGAGARRGTERTVATG